MQGMEAAVHYVVNNAASTGTLRGGLLGKHRYIIWRMTWPAVIYYVVDDTVSTGTLWDRDCDAERRRDGGGWG